MAKGWNKFMDILGLNDDYGDEMEEVLEKEETMKREKERDKDLDDDSMPITPIRPNNSNKVVSINSIQSSSYNSNSTSAKVVITKPTSYEEAAEICDNLRVNKIVVVNINLLDKSVGQRLIDFLGGSTYALDADFQQVDHNIYLLTPKSVKVDNELKNELNSKGLFSFMK